MKYDTYRLQLLLVFLLGIVVLALTYIKDSNGTGKSGVENRGSWSLSWVNDQLQIIAGELKEQHNLKGSKPPPVVTPVLFQRIPINHASEELLATISGIGPVLAQRIISGRNSIGYYSNYKDLKKPCRYNTNIL